MSGFDILKDIPRYSNWSKIEPVLKGWSDDKKFYIEDNKGEKFLLRVSDFSTYDAKRLEYDYINRISILGIPMPKPVEFGICSNGQSVYSLLTWVNGEDAELALPKYNENEQYQLGIKAGKILQKIHTISASVYQEEWGQRYKRKIHRKIEDYLKASIKLENDDAFIKFVEENISYLDDRPQSIQHGDYHVGNLVISQDGEIGVIDFNRIDFGDPWEEFNRCIFSWKVSIPFAIGQIHGYFGNHVPDKFFKLMALYIAVNTISSIPWAVPFGEAEVKYMLSNAKEVFECYDGFKTHIPVWYKDYV